MRNASSVKPVPGKLYRSITSAVLDAGRPELRRAAFSLTFFPQAHRAEVDVACLLGHLLGEPLGQRQIPRQDLGKGHQLEVLSDAHYPQRGKRTVMANRQRAVGFLLGRKDIAQYRCQPVR